MNTTGPNAGIDLEAEARKVGATHRLATMRLRNPELSSAEAQAKLVLAAAIIAMDEVTDRILAGEAVHSMDEQVAVERAKDAHAQALADLLRGETGSATR